jgi:hypothetical protein
VLVTVTVSVVDALTDRDRREVFVASDMERVSDSVSVTDAEVVSERFLSDIVPVESIDMLSYVQEAVCVIVEVGCVMVVAGEKDSVSDLDDVKESWVRAAESLAVFDRKGALPVRETEVVAVCESFSCVPLIDLDVCRDQLRD